MEPISFAAGIIGLWSTCRDGYHFVASVCSANTALAEIATSIIIEGAKVSSWGELWGLYDGHHASREELQDFLDRDPNRKLGTYLILSGLSRKLADARRLEDSFGIKFKSVAQGGLSKDIYTPLNDFAQQTDGDAVAVFDPSALQAWKGRMSFFRRCKWAATSKKRAELLLESLRKFANDLLVICPTVHRQRLQQGVVNLALASDQANLVSLRNAAYHVANLEENRDRRAVYKDLGATAMLRAAIEEEESTQPSAQALPILQATDVLFKHRSAPWMVSSEVALDHSSGAVNYIEWKACAPPGSWLGTADPDMMKLILRLGRLLCAQPRPQNLRMLQCKGIFEDLANNRYGFVYKLPQNLDYIGKTVEKGQLTLRLPVNMKHLLTEPIRSLGYRFWMAKALVDSVIAMHASGWLHKNIQLSSILFFPMASSTRDGPASVGEIDYGRFYLMGCQDSRPGTLDHHLPSTYYIRTESSTDPDPLSSTIYKHPEKLRDPLIPYRHSYDVYSLGIALLEIGLWEPLDKKIPRAIDERLEYLLECSERLFGACGSIYTRCVRQCLQIDTDDLAGKGTLRKLSWTIGKEIALCRA